MAKRDIPEINAGSMADIAFLLLIFFLVTTTMDRDKAYIRPIPKKVDVETPPVDIQERDICDIVANSQNQLMVRGEIIKNPDDISDYVLEFFRTNEDLSTSEMIAASGNRNHPGFNFPFYNRFGMAEINGKIEQTTLEAEEVERTPGAEAAYIEYFWSKVSEWEKRKRALKLYKKAELPELSSQAHVRIEVQINTGYEYFAKIHSEINEAIFELRDEASKDLWGIDYARIVTQLGNEPTEDEITKKKIFQEYLDKMELLKVLYPDRIIEVTPKK
ncbi:MAG: biopolymer transporter ExbD [Crocinitomicaceae bacterium]|nr:biopolymer transporter ExbD [Crocinitomicaceae bacterium]